MAMTAARRTRTWLVELMGWTSLAPKREAGVGAPRQPTPDRRPRRTNDGALGPRSGAPARRMAPVCADEGTMTEGGLRLRVSAGVRPASPDRGCQVLGTVPRCLQDSQAAMALR